MFWTTFKRTIRTGFVNFWRNGVVSLASVFIMTVTLFTAGVIIFIGALLNTTLEQLQNKVDINVYFVPEASEEDIFTMRDTIETLPEVGETFYTSREEALADFRERHKNDPLTLQGLDELDENPLGASLAIKAKETSQYESIAQYLEDKRTSSEEGTIIETINYFQNKVAIDKLSEIITGAKRIGFAVIVLLIIISVLITFNTIRLAIYTAREEIKVMRLVGASNNYVRGPFIIEGVIYGTFSAIIAMLLLYPAALWVGDETEQFFGGINLSSYYVNNATELLLILLVAGVLLGAISSFLAVRRYLKG